MDHEELTCALIQSSSVWGLAGGSASEGERVLLDVTESDEEEPERVAGTLIPSAPRHSSSGILPKRFKVVGNL